MFQLAADEASLESVTIAPEHRGKGAGRALLTKDGETAFQAGASATITGNMLTTVACATIRSDRAMLEGLGRDVTPDYWKEA